MSGVPGAMPALPPLQQDPPRPCWLQQRQEPALCPCQASPPGPHGRRLPMGRGGTGSEELEQIRSQSLRGEGGMLLSWEESWKHCHILQEKSQNYPKYWKSHSHVLV